MIVCDLDGLRLINDTLGHDGDCSYRRAMSVEQALAELQRCAGTQFDPHLVEVFISLIKQADANKQ